MPGLMSKYQDIIGPQSKGRAGRSGSYEGGVTCFMNVEIFG